MCTGFEEFIAREKILLTSVCPTMLEKNRSLVGIFPVSVRLASDGSSGD
jgi:hypothetical protein